MFQPVARDSRRSTTLVVTDACEEVRSWNARAFSFSGASSWARPGVYRVRVEYRGYNGTIVTGHYTVRTRPSQDPQVFLDSIRVEAPWSRLPEPPLLRPAQRNPARPRGAGRPAARRRQSTSRDGLDDDDSESDSRLAVDRGAA
jgi:hypothetical protein